MDSKKGKVVYISGTWDLFHVGHLRAFKKCKEYGDILIVGVSTDELAKSYRSEGPAVPFEQRMEMVESCKYVDKVVKQVALTEKKQVQEINPDIIVIGDDWKDKKLEGLEWFKSQPGKQVVYLPRTEGVSSTMLRQKLREVEKSKVLV